MHAPVRASCICVMKRTLLFVLVTSVWLFFTGVHFYDAARREQSGKVALHDLDLRFTDKLVLASRAPLFAGKGGTIAETLDATAVYDKKIAEEPLLRPRFAVVLMALGDKKRAEEVLKGIDTPQARAVRGAFGLAGERSNDAEALRELPGWLADFALKDDAAVARKATPVAVGLLVIGFALAAYFILGVSFIVILLAAGREWKLRTVEVEQTWDPLYGWSMVLVWHLSSVLIQTLVLVTLGPGRLRESMLGLLVVQLVIYGVILLCVHRLIRGRWIEIGAHFVGWGRCVLLGIASVPVAFIAVAAASLFMSQVVGVSGPSSNPLFEILKESSGPFDVIALFLLAAIVGPVFEEVFFRGVIYQSMRRVLPAVWAIPISAFVFSSAHADFNGIVPLFVLGCLLAWQLERTRSLVTGSVTHAIWNGQTLLASLFLFS
jgi:membrane protease YdiL (CAAX protease family)